MDISARRTYKNASQCQVIGRRKRLADRYLGGLALRILDSVVKLADHIDTVKALPRNDLVNGHSATRGEGAEPDIPPVRG